MARWYYTTAAPSRVCCEGAANRSVLRYSPDNFCVSSAGVAAVMALYFTPG
jgi:hypothetical protein